MTEQENTDLRTILDTLEGSNELYATMVKAISIVNPSEEQKKINNLADMVSEDNVEASYHALVKQDEIDGSVSADDIVTMWEPLEGRYTVSELLDEI